MDEEKQLNKPVALEFTGINDSTEQRLLNYARDHLGFTETTQMEGLRNQMSESDDVAFFALLGEYQPLAEKQVDDTADSEFYSLAQIGLTLTLASVYHNHEFLPECHESLNDARLYATNLRKNIISEQIKSMQSALRDLDSNI